MFCNPVETDLAATIDRVAPILLGVDESVAARRHAEGAWSAKEIIGHLIDSAANNHRRFVEAQLVDHLVFPGYAQDAWVASQRYPDRPWRDLVSLWHAYNQHLCHVIAAVPADVRERPRSRHSLHQIAWQPVPQSEAATLDYFMRDYVGHLRHHVAQVAALLGVAGLTD